MEAKQSPTHLHIRMNQKRNKGEKVNTFFSFYKKCVVFVYSISTLV